MALDDYLDKERREGTAVGGEASFTLDPEKVRERVSVFCKEESFYPLLRCLQAVISVCSGDIFVNREKGKWEINFPWPQCPPTQSFHDLLTLGTTAGFDQVGHRAGQHLFFGLSAALGTENYTLTWESSKAHFHLSQGRFETREPESRDYCRLSFSLEASWWKRLLGIRTAEESEKELARRLWFSPQPIHLQGTKLKPKPPQAPEKPWAAKLVEGSELAWRFRKKLHENFLTIPYPELDYYRRSADGEAFHLIREPETGTLPLSVAFSDPDRYVLQKGDTSHLSLSRSDRAHSALFLSLEAGRQDWLYCTHDGVLCHPTPADIAGGGIVALTSEPSLTYDLSGFRVIENKSLENTLRELKLESKALKRQLWVTLGNTGARAKSLPKHYDQALSYLVGGPYAGLLGGRFGPKVRRLFTRGDK